MLKVMKQAVRSRWLELVITAAIVLLSVVLVVAHRYATRTFESSRAWSSASSELRVRISVGHQWLEDRLAGDPSVHVASQVFDNIDAAQVQCQALIKGARTGVGTIRRLPRGDARTITARACDEITSLRAAAGARLLDGGRDAGGELDQSFDESAAKVLRLARRGEAATGVHIEDRHVLADRVNAATIGFLFLLLGAIVILIHRHQTRVRQLAERSESILNSVGEGIFGTDRDGRITFVNPAGIRMTGYEVEELLGHSKPDLIRHTLPDRTPHPAQDSPVAPSPQSGTYVDREVYFRKDGSSFPVEYTITPIVDGSEVGGAVVVFKDISVRRRTEELLERQRQQLIQAQAVAGFGSWQWDAASDTIDWSDQMCRIYGLEPGRPPATREDFMRLTHADDRALLQAAVNTALESGEPFSCEHRIVRLDGLVRIVQSRGEVITGDDGAALRVHGTARDLTERREVERAKDEFTSVVSHELRTPLTSIRGSLGLLASGVLTASPVKAERMLQIALENTDRLVRLINDILDIERITSGTIGMHPQRCETTDLIDRAMQGIAQVAADAGVTLAAGTEPIAVSADPDRVIQALTNLLGNAVKFSPAGSTVHVFTNRRDGEVLIRVSDRGRGIPSGKLESIFERFQQVDSSDARDKGGTGLGLAICRSIVEQHGGRIWAESVAGQGSTFSFTLPAAQPASAPAAATRRPLILIRQEPEAREVVGADQAIARVLVVEDDLDLATVLIALFERHGLRAVHAATGADAVRLSGELNPDLLILDVGLPDGDGFWVADWLRRHERLRSVPIVVYTARDLDADERERLDTGHTTFMTKGDVTLEQFEHDVLELVRAVPAAAGPVGHGR